MEDSRRPSGIGDRTPRPAPDTTAAAAFAPPPGSGRSVLTFVSALVLVVCGVAGVLSFFTEIPAGYGVLLLAVAAAAAVVLTVLLRRAPRGDRGG
ncbi:hypothetical protein [Blastococcus montanus]|uniref:hypothetical protein n=1 Tax=Blastococcus montanus TaxID=3144973 RepID=UPI00320A1E57